MIALAAALLLAGTDLAEPRRPHAAGVIVRERVVIRVPLRPAPSLRRLTDWKEGRGPRCIDRMRIAGAALSGPRSIDLILRNRTRVRAVLENSCPALDYYFSFFIAPTSDGRICADRDSIRSRVGGECGIDRFRSLTPKPAR